MWMVGYHHLKKNPIKFFLLKGLSLIFYKIDFLVLKLKSHLLKSKVNLLN